VHPGECWAFSGSEGYLVVQLSAAVTVTEVSIEHIPVSLAPSGNINSAPRDFTVWVSQFLRPSLVDESGDSYGYVYFSDAGFFNLFARF